MSASETTTPRPAWAAETAAVAGDLSGVVWQVWTAYLHVEPVTVPVEEELPDTADVTASVRIDGAWPGHVVLRDPGRRRCTGWRCDGTTRSSPSRCCGMCRDGRPAVRSTPDRAGGDGAGPRRQDLRPVCRVSAEIRVGGRTDAPRKGAGR
jgi:hypothetical protein